MQPVNIADNGVRLIERQIAWQRLDTWRSQWNSDPRPFVLLGEEGDGKTWAVASWLNHHIQHLGSFPPVLFVPSTAVESTDPQRLITTVLERQNRPFRRELWEKRLDRWLQREEHTTPLLFLVLDGVNECRSTSWWRELFERLAVSPWRQRVAVVITCRTELWQRHFSPLRHLRTIDWVLPGYDENELQETLASQSLRRDEIAERLLPLLRKPRYFDLMVTHRQQMEQSGDITVARLMYEDWRDRLKRKSLLTELDHETFQRLIRNLAQKSRDGACTLSDQEVNTLVPLLNDRENLLQELLTGGILQSTGTGIHVNERLLTCGFGLLLADQVTQAVEEHKPLDETIGRWLEPHTGMDIKAAICGVAGVNVIRASIEDLRESSIYDTTETLCYALEFARSIAREFLQTSTWVVRGNDEPYTINVS
jgi:hypothetical protein